MTNDMVSTRDIRKAVENLLEQDRFFIVDIQNKEGKLKVIVDGYEGIKLDECVRINRDLRDLFQ